MGTYIDFLAQVRRELQEPVAGVWADASILVWANEAIRDISRRANPDTDEQYADSVVGQALYSLPSGVTKVSSVFYDDVPLIRTTHTDWSNIDVWDDNGTPKWYLMDDETLRLIPPPDSIKTIRFFREHYPTDVDSSGNMPWSGVYDAAIRYYVLRRAMEQTSDWQAANEYAVRYSDEVEKAVSQEIRERSANLSSAPREVW